MGQIADLEQIRGYLGVNEVSVQESNHVFLNRAALYKFKIKLSV